MSPWILGIDPGLGGAVAVLEGTGRLIRVEDTPSLWVRAGRRRRRAYDVAAMRRILARCLLEGNGALHAVIEAQQAMPRQGVRSMFSTGFGYGVWVGLLAGLAIPYTVVAPRRWQSALLMGRGDPKALSILTASQLFPGVSLPRGRHGRADAVLLAEYGRRLVCGAARVARQGRGRTISESIDGLDGPGGVVRRWREA